MIPCKQIHVQRRFNITGQAAPPLLCPYRRGAGGRLRTERVIITGSRYPTPAPEKIPGQMADLVQWMRDNGPSLHPVRFAAQVHKRFVFIHPFIDGNGRIARLLMNLCLLRHGYTLAIVPPILRGEYIALLERAHREDGGFEYFIGERVLETQKDILRGLG